MKKFPGDLIQSNSIEPHTYIYTSSQLKIDWAKNWDFEWRRLIRIESGMICFVISTYELINHARCYYVISKDFVFWINEHHTSR